MAILAVRVEDVRLIAAPEYQEMIRARLGSLFNFIEWQHPKDWAKFCGRYERQMPDGLVLVQQDAYA